MLEFFFFCKGVLHQKACKNIPKPFFEGKIFGLLHNKEGGLHNCGIVFEFLSKKNLGKGLKKTRSFFGKEKKKP